MLHVPGVENRESSDCIAGTPAQVLGLILAQTGGPRGGPNGGCGHALGGRKQRVCNVDPPQEGPDTPGAQRFPANASSGTLNRHPAQAYRPVMFTLSKKLLLT